MKKIELFGETFYETKDIKNYIDLCNMRGEIIFSIEFYRINSDKTIPYNVIQSIDSTELYDGNKSNIENSRICNNFIEACVKKSMNKLHGLFFTSVTDSQV